MFLTNYRIWHWQSHWWGHFHYLKPIIPNISSQPRDMGVWKGRSLLQKEIYWPPKNFNYGWLRTTYLISLWRLKEQIIWPWRLNLLTLPINSNVLPNNSPCSTFDLYPIVKLAYPSHVVQLYGAMCHVFAFFVFI